MLVYIKWLEDKEYWKQKAKIVWSGMIKSYGD